VINDGGGGCGCGCFGGGGGNPFLWTNTTQLPKVKASICWPILLCNSVDDSFKFYNFCVMVDTKCVLL
jgi:hypothetical protein